MSSECNVINYFARRPLGRAATQAVELAWRARSFLRFARAHERAKVFAVNEQRTLSVRRREPGRDPSTNRMLVRAQEGGDLAYGVVSMDFDAAAVVPSRHSSGRLFHEGADILHPPRRRTRPELYRLWKAPGLDAFPPSGSADRDRAARCQNRGKSDEAGMWKRLIALFGCFVSLIDLFHYKPYPSKMTAPAATFHLKSSPSLLGLVRSYRARIKPRKSRKACQRCDSFFAVR